MESKDGQSIAVAKLYYESDMSQQKIAETMQLSRPTVSRLLRYAKEQGYVEIKIIDPTESMTALEDRLRTGLCQNSSSADGDGKRAKKGDWCDGGRISQRCHQGR